MIAKRSSSTVPWRIWSQVIFRPPFCDFSAFREPHVRVRLGKLEHFFEDRCHGGSADYEEVHSENQDPWIATLSAFVQKGECVFECF
jgi:hypothetical protein